MGDVRKVLIRPHADVSAAAHVGGQQIRHDVQKATLTPPYGYLLIPQSYARPEHEPHTTSHCYAHEHDHRET